MTQTEWGKPALLGGQPIVEAPLPIVRPLLPPLAAIQERLDAAMQSGQLTNGGRHVQALEAQLAAYFAVAHVVAVNNATIGLLLLLRALAADGEVILPSFTYAASAHAVVWAGLRPVFVDILPDTYTLDPAAVARAITPRTAAIMGVHIYGHPCEIDDLQEVADHHGIPLIFDAAHAMGSRYRQQRVGGFGLAEVFSFHATKIFPVGEGSVIATSDTQLAQKLRLLRVFGSPPGEENTLLPGLNGKMQEFNALIGLENLKNIDRYVTQRRALVDQMRAEIAHLPGLHFQTQRPHVYSNYQNLSLLVDAGAFGLSRDALFVALRADNVHTRRYFHPPVHRHDAYAGSEHAHLPVTDRVADTVLCLPIYSQMQAQEAHALCLTLRRLHAFAPAVRERLRAEGAAGSAGGC
ncbi:MAG: DegT/DnrJ/EryC1/StrS family aminotransferase [Caldilineales bacterium]|nr:DegT/DnrJ/EryC1/StrS family aminotransferase [Caldilineales bacterium]